MERTPNYHKLLFIFLTGCPRRASSQRPWFPFPYSSLLWRPASRGDGAIPLRAGIRRTSHYAPEHPRSTRLKPFSCRWSRVLEGSMKYFLFKYFYLSECIRRDLLTQLTLLLWLPFHPERFCLLLFEVEHVPRHWRPTSPCRIERSPLQHASRNCFADLPSSPTTSTITRGFLEKYSRITSQRRQSRVHHFPEAANSPARTK